MKSWIVKYYIKQIYTTFIDAETRDDAEKQLKGTDVNELRDEGRFEVEVDVISVRRNLMMHKPCGGHGCSACGGSGKERPYDE